MFFYVFVCVSPNTNKNKYCCFISGSLTRDLHPDAEVDVGVAEVPLHQDVVPLLPGGDGRDQLTRVPLPAVEGTRVVDRRRPGSYLQHHGATVAALVPGAAVHQLNLHLRHVIGDEHSVCARRQTDTMRGR